LLLPTADRPLQNVAPDQADNYLDPVTDWYDKCRAGYHLHKATAHPGVAVPKRAPGHSPDPMAGVVDRLLAQLPGLQGEAPHAQFASRNHSTAPGVLGSAPPREELLGPWMRVLLALSLGTAIGWWPYPRSCGFPLVGYFGALVTVILAAGWAAGSSWRHRAKLAHILSLILLFYGMLMAMAELLPRTGYAVDRASWGCEAGPV
jgi:hypothetical protein